MTPTERVLRAVLKMIIDVDDWIDLWAIRITSGYSTEYVRQAVKELYWKRGALQRMRKGAKFLYRSSAKAQKVLEAMERSDEGDNAD